MLLLCSGIDEKFEHAQVLREHYVFLLDALDAKHSGLVRRLQQAEVLSKDEARSINSEVLPMRQNEKLLSILSGKIKEQFDKFLEALDKTGQQRVRNHITGRKRHHKGAFLQNRTK